MQPKTLSSISWTCLLGISGTLALLLTSSSTKAAVANLAPATTQGYVPVFDTRLALTNSWWYYTVNGMGTDRNIYFGPGTTNVLYRSGASLVIINGAITNGLEIVNGSGYKLYLNFKPSNEPYIASSDGTIYFQSFVEVPGSIQPNGTASLGINSSSGFWNGAYVKSGFHLNGFGPGGVDYSELVVTHGGTNDAIHFDSQAAGTAGNPRPFDWDFGGTNVMQLQQTVGAVAPALVFKDAASASHTTLSHIGSVGSLTTSGSGTLSLSARTITGTCNTFDFFKSGYTSSPFLRIYGFLGGGDSSILSISHGGTNDAIHFDSQSSGVAGNPRNFKFDNNGVAVFTIPATNIWDDSMVPEALVRVGASAPSQANFNGGPGQTLQFQNNRDDAILASVQLSHRYKQGTDVYPHVHWAEVATTGAGTNVVWELQYTWANPAAGVFPAYSTLLMTNSVTGTNWWHSMHSFPAISGSGKAVSAIMVFQLRRLANSAAADNYDQNVAFLGFDLHYQVDSPGSDNPVVKSF